MSPDRIVISSNEMEFLTLRMLFLLVELLNTYERTCIEKWFAAGHLTCPKTKQKLSSAALTPNFVLSNLIDRWCEANGKEPRARIDILVNKLNFGNHEDVQSAAGVLRLIAKHNTENCVRIAEAGGIPYLASSLYNSNLLTQKDAVAALLSLSISEDSRGSIVTSMVDSIVHVLGQGSMEAREDAAAILFRLSDENDENKVTIGKTGAIEELVTLLSEGSQRGKKEGAIALLNLFKLQENQAWAVLAGVVPTLKRLLTELERGIVDFALCIVVTLASHSEWKEAIEAADALPVMVEVIERGQIVVKMVKRQKDIITIG
ncbi:protein spotted leaf 11-like [Telopea speciosissima]|uniref:protein spotted leaf 11-like n=1 Tax=Telopea speciosissima TaxID=54955 RepID=UPI001CC3426D|nr:protein spotted leaf 11-like [Telopea speciosissima]